MENNDKSMVGKPKYKRVEADFYATESWITEALVKMLPEIIKNPIWEPACGEGDIAEVLKKYQKDILCSDLFDRNYGESGRDFLKETSPTNRNIITNPPYAEKLPQDFIETALFLTKNGGGRFVAMLLRNEFDCAKTRLHLFQDVRFAYKIVLTKRPRWIKESKGAPRHNYSWFVWDNEKISENPEILYFKE